jgi:hypothetical protein
MSSVGACLLAALPASAEVHVATNRGFVSIVAKDATPREILAEWARVGQVNVVNLDRIPGVPLTIELINMPEGQALDVVLRSLSGYMAAPREQPAAGLSMFDRVYVIPVAASTRAVTIAAPPAPAAPQAMAFPQPPSPVDGYQRPDDQSAEPAAPGTRPAPMFQPGRRASEPPSIVGAPPQPNEYSGQAAMPSDAPRAPVAPSAPGSPATTGTAPAGTGTSAPGMMTPSVPAPRVDPATWRPGMPTRLPDIPAGVPSARPGEVGRPTGSGQSTTATGGATARN